jgi:hypothetical protein
MRMMFQVYLHVKIARISALGTRIASAGNAKRGAVIGTGRNLDIE